MQRHTVFLSRLLGLSTLIVTLWLLADRHAAMTTIDAFVGAHAIHLLWALIALGVGVAMVRGHTIWPSRRHERIFYGKKEHPPKPKKKQTLDHNTK